MQVTGIGKGDKKSEQQDTQQQELDQSPAGEDEASPEFTTTSKETLPSGKETVTTTKDDVPVPADKDTTTTSTDDDVSTKDQDQDTSADAPKPSTKDSKPAAKPTAATPKKDPTPSAAPTQSKSTPAGPTPTATQESAGPLNKLRNMGGGSQRMPGTPKRWKKDGSSWHPDAAGIHYPPG